MRSTQNLILILVLLWAAACGGPRRITPQSPLDSAQVQYDRGVQALAEGDLRVAQAQFDRAHGLDENFAGSFVGDALVALAQGDHFRARQAIEQALHRDDRFVDAHIALGRIVADEGLSKGRNSSAWLEESTRSYVRAGELEPEHRVCRGKETSGKRMDLERETGVEPATSSLGSLRSTPELLPLR